MRIRRRRADRHAGASNRSRRWVTRATLGLAAVVMVAGLPACDPAPPNPILVVGGHGMQLQDAQGLAAYLVGELGYESDWAAGVELASQPGKDYPLDSGHTDWPGSEYASVSADVIQTAIEDLYAAAGDTPIDIVAVSQGAPTTRALLQDNPDDVRSKVAGYISLSGANSGVPDSDWVNAIGCFFYQLNVCSEIVYPSGSPGVSDWLEDEVNMPSGSGPVPGSSTIDYYHVYTEIFPSGTLGTPAAQGEAATPYGWSVPLQGAVNMSVQDACPSNPDRPAPHVGYWTDGTDTDTLPDPDLVMDELLKDALSRAALSIDAPSTTCLDQPGRP